MTELSTTRFPYTGPLYGPSHERPASKDRSTVKALKRAMIRTRYMGGTLGEETDDFGPELEGAMKAWYKEEYGVKWTYYGLGSWRGLRSLRVPRGTPNAGQYALDARALEYVRADALKQCYPHPAGARGEVGQGLHQTSGIAGNWGIDFMAPGGTKVLAVESAVVTRLSGRSPSDGASQAIGIFGWSIYYATPGGYSYFSTHYGKRTVELGQHVDCGHVVGEVGNWPGDPGRSHTHLGCSSAMGQAAAKKRILEIAGARRVAA